MVLYELQLDFAWVADKPYDSVVLALFVRTGMTSDCVYSFGYYFAFPDSLAQNNNGFCRFFFPLPCLRSSAATLSMPEDFPPFRVLQIEASSGDV